MAVGGPVLTDDGKQELAKERTDLAEDRTLLANERTYAGWMRTGFASIAVGLGFQALFELLKPPWVPKAIATAFLAIAIFVFLSAERRAAAMTKRFHPHEVETFQARQSAADHDRGRGRDVGAHCRDLGPRALAAFAAV